MKKVLIGIMALILGVFIVGCGGNKKPDGVSQETYDLAIYTIKVVDLYLNGEASLEDTYSKIKEINVEIGYDSEYKQNSNISTTIFLLKSDISLMSLREKSDSSDLSKLKESRNKLAKEINYKD